jgi:uncharacterized repeat protein (TIGR01451 family)
VNVDRRWLGACVVRIPVLAAALVLLAAGAMILGLGSRSRQIPLQTASRHSAIQNQAADTSVPAANQFASPGAVRYAQPSNATSVFARLPLIFEPNRGQANLDPAETRTQFLAHGSGYTLLLGSEGAILSLHARHAAAERDNHNANAQLDIFESLEMKLAGADRNASPVASDPLPGRSNYLIGNDPANWRTGIPQFARVRYENIYPGINLVFYGNQGHLEYDFQVAPGSDPARAEMEFQGARKMELKDGSLVIQCKVGVVRLEAPRAYQEIAGHQQVIDSAFVLRGPNRAGFAVGPYDRSRELIIDPVPGFSSYFGGVNDEHNTSVALDAGGNIYLTGSTNSPTLPVAGGTVLQAGLVGVRNVYVAKINPNLNPPVLQYVTYLGGSGTDTPVGIGVDGAGDALVAGTTSSPNFPTTPTGYQTAAETGSPGPHVFVSKLNPAATGLLYGSYLSGNGTDTASGMTIDGAANLYVTGTTSSSDVGSPTGAQFPSSSLPYATPFQPAPLAALQFFVTKVATFNAGKASIAYSTYFGGANIQPGATLSANVGGGIAVDTNFNIYFSGTTNFTYTNGAVGDFPILNAYQPCLDQVPPTVIVTNPICTNASTATTTDGFVAKITPPPTVTSSGPQLQWSTYFGGANTDSSTGVALDTGAANVYIVGTTNSQPITQLTSFAGFQVCLNTPVNPVPPVFCSTTAPASAPSDAYVARFTNPAASTTTTVNMALTYFSYLGGSGNEAGQAITVDTASGALITGWTQSTDFPVFPTPSDIQSSLLGPQNALIARLNTAAVSGQNTTASWSSYFGGSGTDQGTSIALDVNQNTYFAGDTNSPNLHVSELFTAIAGGFDAFVTQLRTASSMSIIGNLTVGVNQTFISAGNQATFTYIVTNNGPDPASNITVTDNLSSQFTGWPLTFVSASVTSGSCSGGSTTTVVTCIIPSLQAGSTATVTIVVTPNASTSGSTANFNGGTVNVFGPNDISPLASTSVSASMSDYRLSVSPPSNFVTAAGNTAVYHVQLTPNPVYGSNISLSCTGVPTGGACAFTTATVTLQGTSPGATTLNITTTARPITTTSLWHGRGVLYSTWLFVPGMVFIGAGIRGDRRRRRIAGLLMLSVLFTLLLLLPACGGTTTQPPVSGTPAGTYNITVTATSGSDIKSQGIQLTVP